MAEIKLTGISIIIKIGDLIEEIITIDIMENTRTEIMIDLIKEEKKIKKLMIQVRN